MSAANLKNRHGSKPRFGATRPTAGASHTGPRPAPRISGSAQQKQAQWLTRADDAERRGDAVEAEMCRQYAEHWFRVSRGQD